MEELTKQQEELINNLEVYAQLEVEKETKALQDLIDLVSASVDIRLVNGSVISDIRLGSFELEALAMRIPAECSRLQARLNQYNTKNLFRDMRLDAKVAVELSRLIGTKGAAEERKKKAEMSVLDERVQNAVNTPARMAPPERS